MRAHGNALVSCRASTAKPKKVAINYLTPELQFVAEGTVPISRTEVVLHILVHHPRKKNQVMQEWLVLGSQGLVELRDKLHCATDKIVETLMLPTTTKSGYFFIENVFYNDRRHPDSIDYSAYEHVSATAGNQSPPCTDGLLLLRARRPIIQWTQENRRFAQPGLGVYTSCNMEGVTFEDISVRLGTPYLYCHQGNCEHVLIVNEVRYASPTTE